MATKIKIARWRNLRSRFASGPGPAWTYRYDVTVDGRGPGSFRTGKGGDVVLGAELLSIARRKAREAAKVIGGEVEIVEVWTAPQALTDAEILAATNGAVDFAFRSGDLYVQRAERGRLVRNGYLGDDARVREVIAMLRGAGREL